MIETVRRLAPSLALVAALVAQGHARAQSVEPPVAPVAPAPAAAANVAPLSESDLRARHIIRQGLADLETFKPAIDSALDKAQTAIKAEAAKKGGPAQAAYDRFGYWGRLLSDAAWEELANDGPAAERILGPYMVRHFTPGELHAVSDLLDDPAFADIRANAMATGESQAAREEKMKPAGRALLRRFRHSPDGRSFMAKFDALDKSPDFEPTILELVAAWTPGVARRWGEKAEAAEAARDAPADAGSTPTLSEADSLARHIVTVSVARLSDMKPLMNVGFDKAEPIMKAMVAKGGPAAQMAWDRLGYWYRLLGDAAFEEVASAGPKFERILRPYMVKHFSLEELHAVSALLDDPALPEIRAFVLARTASPYSSVTMSPAAQAAANRFSHSAGGKSFMAKVRTLVAEPDFEPTALEIVAAAVPGTMRRWGEKVGAAEAARTAGQTGVADTNDGGGAAALSTSARRP